MGIGLSLLAILVFVFLPSFRKLLIRENHILEISTALLYVWACLLSVRNVRRFQHGVAKNVALGMAIVSLMSFLEEINYGIYFIRNYYYFPTPKWYGQKFDALHDLLEIGLKVIQVELGLSSFQVLGLVGVCMGLGMVLLSIWVKYHFLSLVGCFSRHPFIWFVVCWFVLMAVANVHDLLLRSSHDPYDFGQLVEEQLEMLAALALVFSGLMMKVGLGKGAGD